MFGPNRVQLDLSRIARRISGDGANPISDEELERWLNAHGFTRDEDGWRVEWHRKLFALLPGEVTDVRTMSGRPIFKPGGSFIPSARALHEEFEKTEARNAEVAKTAGPREIDECLVPCKLIGLSPKAVSSWRTITRRAARLGNWDRALEGVPLIPIDHAPGDLLFHAFAGPHDWPNVALHAVHDHFATDTKREDLTEWGALERHLLLDGIGRFWFCLASLAGHWTMIIDQAPEELRPPMARTILQAFVRWWPDFIRLSPRFLTIGDHPYPWPRWSWSPMQMCLQLGVDNAEIEAVKEGGPVACSEFMTSCLSR